MTLTPWRRSSFSTDTSGNCIEVAFGSVCVAVRDSKNAAGPRLTVDLEGWRAMIALTNLGP